jgi:hypothetical protein
MADIEKMREVFEEVLKAYRDSESASIEEMGNSSEYHELDCEVDSFRTRFNEAVMANQNPTVVNVNLSGSIISEADLVKKVKEILSQQARSALLGSAS